MTSNLSLHQPSLPGLCSVAAAVESLAGVGESAARGAVFTRREVVDFILDLAGYTVDQPLHRRKLLEPSFGNGDFLLPAIERLLTAWRAFGETAQAVDALGACICAVELHRDTFDRTRAAVLECLVNADIPERAAVALANRWLVQGDFLLVTLPEPFDIVVGNSLMSVKS